MSFSLSLWLKQCRVFGSVLLAIAITAYSTSVKLQPAAANPSPVANASIMPSSTHPPSPTPSVSDSAPISLAQNTAATDPTPQQAVQVIRDYYNEIARRDYARAYSAWGSNGAASQQSFEQFQQGFANIACVAVEVGEPGIPDAGAGSIYIEVPVTVTAITTNRTTHGLKNIDHCCDRVALN